VLTVDDVRICDCTRRAAVEAVVGSDIARAAGV
jgi:hypothetical protein